MARDPDSTLDRALDGGAPDSDVAEDLARARLRGELFGTPSDPVRIGRYTVLHKIGAGGNGVVYAAYDDRLDRKIALKVLQPNSRTDPTRARSRLVAEAQALAKLAHPNIVTVFEVFVDEARDVVIAMEFIVGDTLWSWALEPDRPWVDVLAKYRAAGRGLAAAHAAGLVHRDFKPSNAIVGDDGRVRVLDFGLVRVDRESLDRVSLDRESLDRSGSGPAARTGEDAPNAPVSDDRPTVDDSHRADGGPASATGVVGTPVYMPPEQHQGRSADARSDQYSFCASLWEALMGEPPFAGETLPGLYAHKLKDDLVPPPRTEVPTSVLEALARGLKPAPQERFESMEALLQALAWNPVATRRRWLTAGAIVGAAVAGVGYGMTADDAPCGDVGASIDAVWTETRAEAISEAFRAIDKSYAEPSWKTARLLVERWTGTWVEARRDACLAHDRGEQSAQMLDLRTACLDGKRLALEALLEVYDSADDDVVERAVRAARSLPTVAICSDASLLRAAVPPPSDPQVRERVEALQQPLARSRANIESGRYALAQELATEVVAELDEAQWTYAPLRAEALLARGDALSRSGHPREALPLLREGTLLAQSLGDPSLFVEGATNLVWEYGDSRTDYDVAHTWADLARSTLRSMGEDDELTGRLHNNVGSVLTNEQRYDEALTEHRARLELVGESSGHAFLSLANIGNIFNYRGQWTEAVEHYDRAIEVAALELGADHPQVLRVRGNLLGVMWRTKSPDEARAYGEELLVDQHAVHGDAHPNLATSYANLALIAGTQQDEAGERRFAEEALRQAETVYGTQSHMAIAALLRLSHLETEARVYDKARSYGQRALDLALSTRGPDHLDTAYAQENMGSVTLYAGDPKGALPFYIEARRIVQVSQAPEELAGIAESYMAIILSEVGRADEALPLAESAADRFERTGGTEKDILIARNRVAQALVDVRRYDEALSHLEETLQRWTKLGPAAGKYAALFDQLRAHVETGRAERDPEAARSLAQQADDVLLHRRVEAWLTPQSRSASP